MTRPTDIYQSISRDLLENFLWQHQVSAVAFQQALTRGQARGRPTALAYTFECRSPEAAEGLRGYLAEQSSDVITTAQRDGSWLLSGTAAEVGFDLGLILEWVGYLCDAGSQFDSRFDGWTIAPAQGPPAPSPSNSAGAGAIPLPPDISEDPAAVELARVWTAQDRQFFLLNAAGLPEPAAWGIVALDLMKHAARAYRRIDGRSEQDAHKRILAGFMAEMQNPSDRL